MSIGAAGTVAIPTGSPPLVFIHGIKGSILANSHDAVSWLNLWQGLGLSSPDLSLPLQWNGETPAATQAKDGLRATEPISTVAFQDVYGTFLGWAKTSGRRFYPFAYDWRRDNLETTDTFVQFLEKIRRENDGSKIQVVAHSMGGLITFAALQRRPDLFQSVLFAGVPFGSSISFLEDMHAGTSTGFNSSILSPKVFFTFASPYCFFPSDPKDSGLIEANGTPIMHDWYSADDWARQKLGIFATGAASNEQWTHLRHALDHARRFRSEIAYQSSMAYPPIAILAGNTIPTVTAVMRNGPRAVRGWDSVTAARKQGDNRIDFTRALPPAGVPHHVFKSTRAHGDLLSDTRQVETILNGLIR